MRWFLLGFAGLTIGMLCTKVALASDEGSRYVLPLSAIRWSACPNPQPGDMIDIEQQLPYSMPSPVVTEALVLSTPTVAGEKSLTLEADPKELSALKRAYQKHMCLMMSPFGPKPVVGEIIRIISGPYCGESEHVFPRIPPARPTPGVKMSVRFREVVMGAERPEETQTVSAYWGKQVSCEAIKAGQSFVGRIIRSGRLVVDQVGSNK